MDRMPSRNWAEAGRRRPQPAPAVRFGGRRAARRSFARAIVTALCGAWLTSATVLAQPAPSPGGSHLADAAPQSAWMAGNQASEAHVPSALPGEIIGWLAANFALPATIEQPKIVLLPAGDMDRIRFHILLQGQPATARPDRLERRAQATLQVAAFYDDGARTIYLPDTWRRGDPRAVSILVHEMVHHLQHMGGFKYACAQARERLAFAAQEKWLAISGMSLESAFNLNRMTILLRTRCLY